MKQVHLTLNIPDNKYEELLHFLSQNFNVLSSVKIGDDVPEWHKDIVRDRKINTNKKDYITLEELNAKIQL